MTLIVDGVSLDLDGTTILDDVDVAVTPGEIVGLVGPNGSGKSSLLRCIARLQGFGNGAVSLDGADLASLPRRKLGQRLALVEQQAGTELDITVTDVVLLGRTAHRRRWQAEPTRDLALARDALCAVNMAGFADRSWLTLSGGEQQRVHLARALVQEPTLLLLDEPTNHLDVHHQLQILDLLRVSGLATLVALHDLNHAARCCDSLIVMHRGRVHAHGPVDEVLTRCLLREVFDVETTIVPHPTTGRPVVLLDEVCGQPDAANNVRAVLFDIGDTLVRAATPGTAVEDLHVELIGDVVGDLAALARDYRLGAVTDTSVMTSADVRHLLAGSGLDELLEVIVTSVDVGAAKPDPRGLHAAMRRLGVSAAETIFVGDADVDAAAARTAGVEFVRFTDGPETAANLAAAAIRERGAPVRLAQQPVGVR